MFLQIQAQMFPRHDVAEDGQGLVARGVGSVCREADCLADLCLGAGCVGPDAESSADDVPLAFVEFLHGGSDVASHGSFFDSRAVRCRPYRASRQSP